MSTFEKKHGRLATILFKQSQKANVLITISWCNISKITMYVLFALTCDTNNESMECKKRFLTRRRVISTTMETSQRTILVESKKKKQNVKMHSVNATEVEAKAKPCFRNSGFRCTLHFHIESSYLQCLVNDL